MQYVVGAVVLILARWSAVVVGTYIVGGECLEVGEGRI